MIEMADILSVMHGEMKCPAASECEEPLVNVKDYKSQILIEMEETSRKQQNITKDSCLLRKSVAQKLLNAQSLLPNGLRLKLIDGYRPLSAQREIFTEYFNAYKQKHKGCTDEEAEKDTEMWVTNPKKVTPPHSTGGAMDITIIDASNKELEMGSPINAADGRLAKTDSSLISQVERKNRNLLISTMQTAGFTNYPMEWWHWSYGEWMWAMTEGKEAIYDSVKG
jgi:D-alanyl-D-alanine dipeptidase